MENIEKIKPTGLFTNYVYKTIPLAFDESMSYYECLCGLLDYLKNTVIPAVNNNGDAVVELQDLYTQLKSYVDNYFDNLDVQEEINNKLDEMAENGQLTDIIAQYLQLAGVLAFNTINDLKEAENITNGSICKTLGKTTYNDGYGSFYKIRTIINTDVVDGYNIVALDISNTLIAERIPSHYESMIEKESRNSKYMLYIFTEDNNRQSLSYVRDLLTRGVNAGFKEAQILIHIKNDGTIYEDEDKLSDYNDIANELNIPITSLKFHGNYTATNYQTVLLRVLGYFPNVNTVFIFNEQDDNVYANGLTYPGIIKTAYPNVEKVGFTIAYNKAFWNNTITLSQWNSIQEYFDILGVHMYPSCSSYSDASLCNYDKVINAFNKPSFIIPWKKEVWITESGVLPYWQFMNNPEAYDVTKLTDDTQTTAPQYMFYRALNNCDFAQKANKIIPWYIESGVDDVNHELFDILENIIKGR